VHLFFRSSIAYRRDGRSPYILRRRSQLNGLVWYDSTVSFRPRGVPLFLSPSPDDLEVPSGERGSGDCTEKTVYLEPGWERRAEPDKGEGRIVEVMDKGKRESESEMKEGKPGERLTETISDTTHLTLYLDRFNLSYHGRTRLHP
jgi:hypothetical protein